jgi:hypothetical protein
MGWPDCCWQTLNRRHSAAALLFAQDLLDAGNGLVDRLLGG